MGAEWSLKEKNEHKMEVGSIVTLKLAENNSASNTYVISKIIDDSCLLFHPLLPDVFILRNKSDLDLVMATPKDSTLKILEFVSDYRRHLSPEDLADFEALCMYFIVHRKLANRQKHVLSSLGGKIASEYCMDDISIAIRTVQSNKALLDDFNTMWYSNFEKIFLGEKPVTSKRQRISIFNMTGFVLAQVHNKTYDISKKQDQRD